MSSDRHSTVRSSTGASLLNYLDIILEMKNLLDFMENILDTHINLVFQLILFSSSYSKLSNEASLWLSQLTSKTLSSSHRDQFVNDIS